MASIQNLWPNLILIQYLYSVPQSILQAIILPKKVWKYNELLILPWCFPQVYIHNEALILSARHNIVDGFMELTDRFDDPVRNIPCNIT